MRRIKLDVIFARSKTGLKVREIFKQFAHEKFFCEEEEITDAGIGSVIGLQLKPVLKEGDFCDDDYLLTLILKPQGEDVVFYDNVYYGRAELVSWRPERITQEEYFEVLNSVPAGDLLEICNKQRAAIESEFAKDLSVLLKGEES